MTVPLSVLVGLILLHLSPGLLASTQVANSPYASIEARCSANTAGVTWFDFTMEYGSVRAQTLKLTFSCSNEMIEDIVTHQTDQCFHKHGQVSIDLRKPHTSMTHVLATKLDPETTCIFKAEVRVNYKLIETLRANCTVGDQPTVLPAICDYFNDECHCSCSSGFSGQANNDIDGNVCEPIETSSEIQAPTPSSTTTRLLQTAIFSRASTQTAPGIILSKVLEQTQVSAGPFTTTRGTINARTTYQYTTITVMSSSPTALYSTEPPPHMSTNTLAFCSVPIALLLLLIGSVMSILGLIVCQKYKLKRLHENLAIPFPAMKNEKIDPDFNPIKIDERVPVSESMHSIFHTFGSQIETGKQKLNPLAEPSTLNTTHTVAKEKQSPLMNDYIQYDTLFQPAGQEIKGKGMFYLTMNELLYNCDYSLEQGQVAMDIQTPGDELTDLNYSSVPMVVHDEPIGCEEDDTSSEMVQASASTDQMSKDEYVIPPYGNQLQLNASGYVVDTSVQPEESKVFFELPQEEK